MSKSEYIGINNVARKVKGIYVGVNGVARKVTKGYIGVGGVARLFYAGYTWKKYNVSQQWNYKETYNDLSMSITPNYYRLAFINNPTMMNYNFIVYIGPSVSTSFNNNNGQFSASNYSSSYREPPNRIGSASNISGAYYEVGVGNGVCILNQYNIGSESVSFNNDWRDSDGDRWRTIDISPGTYGPILVKANQSNSRRISIFESYSMPIQGSYIGIVTSSNPNAYPLNGIHSDGYWYVKQ